MVEVMPGRMYGKREENEMRERGRTTENKDDEISAPILRFVWLKCG
jgi:hypothetical protein